MGFPTFAFWDIVSKNPVATEKKTWFGTYHGPCNKWLPVGWQAPIQPTLQWDQEIQEGVCHCRPEKHQPLGFTLEQGRIGTVTTGAVTGGTTQDSRGEPPSVCMIVICIYIYYIYLNTYIYIYTHVYIQCIISRYLKISLEIMVLASIYFSTSLTHMYTVHIYTHGMTFPFVETYCNRKACAFHSSHAPNTVSWHRKIYHVLTCYKPMQSSWKFPLK